MNHIKLIATFVIVQCKRFTQFQASNSREAVSTRPIIKFGNRALSRFSFALSLVNKAAFTRLPILRLITLHNIATRPTQGNKNIGSDLRFYPFQTISYLTRTVLSRLEPFRGSERAARGIARSVAVAIGITLSIPMASADGGSIDAIQPKNYVKAIMPKHEAICLSRLIGKESAWNSKAIGNLSSPSKSYTYGLLQLKNPIVKDKSAIEQINYGLRYIEHRYDGSTCKAWKHWERKGWH